MTVQLSRASGPDCPKCGCNQVELVRAGELAGRPWAMYACGHCADTFRIGAPPPEGRTVVYNPVRCPACNSKDCPVHTTRRRTRYHKCRDCGASFKSQEA